MPPPDPLEGIMETIRDFAVTRVNSGAHLPFFEFTSETNECIQGRVREVSLIVWHWELMVSIW
jgi:hypothetical protein